MNRILKITSVSMALWLGGCVVGQSIDMAPTSVEQRSVISADLSDRVVVVDERPYVVSGDKPPYFIGKYRSGFGIPYDVSTENNVPLADVIHRDLLNRLAGQSEKLEDYTVSVVIKDWNFDAYQNGKFQYQLLVDVLDSSGAKVDSQIFSETRGVTGTFWSGGKGGFERDMPVIFDSVMSELVAPDSAIGRVLK